MFEGADAVCNFATHVPVGLAAVRPHAWRAHDRLRTDGVRRVVEAAREARVRRVVQESVSFLYAGQGDDWVGEDSPVEITRATEPASVGESHVQDYACGSRTGVVLRLGTIVGDDPMTRFQLRAVRHGHAIGTGTPEGWAHVVHTDDLGPAVLAALSAPSGVYNVGAQPVRRVDLVAGYSMAAGRASIDFMGPLMRRLGGARLEPLARSLRVSSEHFTAQTGWTPAGRPLRRPVVRRRRPARAAAVSEPDPALAPTAAPTITGDADRAERRRRRARVFGDVLPDSTSDDREARGRLERATTSARGRPTQRAARAQVPPHHG